MESCVRKENSDLRHHNRKVPTASTTTTSNSTTASTTTTTTTTKTKTSNQILKTKAKIFSLSPEDEEVDAILRVS